MDILGIGGVALDTIQVVDHLPIRDGFCTVQSERRMLGGSGVNVLVQAQRLGAQTATISKVSSDADSDVIIESLVECGIDIRGVVRDGGGYPAPHCLIYVDNHGEKALVLDAVESLPGLAENEVRFDLVDETSVLYLDLNPPDLSLRAAQQAKRLGKKVVLNMQEDLETVFAKGIDRAYIDDFLHSVDVFAPCQANIRPLSGSDNPREQIAFIRTKFDGTILLTLADKGVVAVDDNNQYVSFRAFDIDVKDTTGAGDAFIGAFMTKSLIEGLALQESVRYSSACAAITCMGFGAQTSPNADQVRAFLSSHTLEVNND